VSTAPATEAAKQWQGWGTALKPAAEHWILARKPLIGTVAANVQAYGTGAINIDGCRIAGKWTTWQAERGEPIPANVSGSIYGGGKGLTGGFVSHEHSQGRWPANVTLDESAAESLDAQSGTLKSGNPVGMRQKRGTFSHNKIETTLTGFGDSGGASRFFYVAKPSTKERNAGLKSNTHPTVKPIALMRYLCRLITPPNGIVLDPFTGSGTTGCAAVLEGFDFVGIEQSADYCAIARRRLSAAAQQPALEGVA
jgi:site-specific DNA-methyltransferase (adenine-specific)